MKILIALVTTLVLAGAAVFYTVHAAGRDVVVVPVDPAAVDLTTPGRLVFRNEAAGPDQGAVASVSLDDPAGPRRLSSLRCGRFAVSAGTGLCLADAPGPLPSAVALVVDARLAEINRTAVAGVPNRARLSPDGALAAWTTFVTGDSYSTPGSFSTRAAMLDRRDGQLASNIEGIVLRVAGERHSAEDLNYWGVTFAADNRTFYATVSTGGRTYLVRGDFDTWQAETLRENAECPSLSPDGTRVAFKKRVQQDGARPWREHVLDLATMKETPLAETRSIDDQVAWLDDRTLAYALPGDGRTDIWTVRADGSGSPRLLVPHASSPALSASAGA
ncbi:hypothetical protein FKR81_00435 [Lentzea tibetensis]|uniref:WD40-like Beta Propeller Repeat n=1 Tax=Lentzea tibetensis TaxID=2591470 RepID=A0A563F3Y5_9PSEU|nr:PD40 domain-containing protein [Lentzea tibetensis]TWP54074.1 hypothetical protein FKR81_00435 [Lentzea tibetensis]